MFELRNSDENRRKRSEIFFENLPRKYKDLILVKKKFKIISCLYTFNLQFFKQLLGLKNMREKAGPGENVKKEFDGKKAGLSYLHGGVHKEHNNGDGVDGHENTHAASTLKLKRQSQENSNPQKGNVTCIRG
jgi:hypothetical protein